MKRTLFVIAACLTSADAIAQQVIVDSPRQVIINGGAGQLPPPPPPPMPGVGGGPMLPGMPPRAIPST